MATQSLLLLWLVGFLSLIATSLGVTLPLPELASRDDNLPARVPYVFPAPGTNAIADAIRARRTDGVLLALDGALLNAPLVASAWNDIFTVIRNNNTIPGTMRELFILRIAVLNDASYEWIQHESVGRAEGLTTKQLIAIRRTPAFVESKDLADTLGPSLAAAMAFADWITKSVHVPDRIFANLQKHLNDQQLVEATATTGGYNFVSRFVVALDVDGKMNVPVPIPK
ncbi:4-carboxymuconolactone decarboxylase [Collybia nuda]|uniref:4-carboxymuconolactone decarboxylase n=1 Tax=Collybia nuda TaxID=64659 RepID=A0A9P6CHU5_9AGAR|nr:4-carboxymuconolactone decarboxylase [Collybia nuda]